VSTTIALRWRRIAREWRSSDFGAGAAAIDAISNGRRRAFLTAREAAID